MVIIQDEKNYVLMSWIQKPKLPSEEEIESGLLPPKPPSDPNKVQRGKATRTRLQQSTSVESSLSSEVKSRLDTSPSDGNCWYVVYLIVNYQWKLFVIWTILSVWRIEKLCIFLKQNILLVYKLDLWVDYIHLYDIIKPLCH